MWVRFKYNWFSPGGHMAERYVVGKGEGRNQNEFDVPDEWKDALPPSAEIIEDKTDEEEFDPTADAENAAKVNAEMDEAAENAAREAENKQAGKENAAARVARARKRSSTKAAT